MHVPRVFRSTSPRSWASTLLLAIIIVGIGLRARELLSFRSLWLDEIALILQIKGSTYERILRSGVGGNQGAPAFYLIITRWFLRTLSHIEIGARLLPFLAGLGFLFTALGLCRAVFANTRERVLFLALCATSPLLVQYSTEGKHYMLETLIASLLVLAFLKYQRGELSHAKMGALGALSIWCAHCAPIILCAGGIVRIGQEFRDKRYRECLIIIGLALTWVLSFALHAITNLSRLLGNNALHFYWRKGFAPWNEGALAVAMWAYQAWANFTRYALLPFQLFHGDATPLAMTAPALSFILLAVIVSGLTIFIQRRSPVAPYLCATFGVAFSLALFHAAPFSSRLILYLTPFVFMCCAATVSVALGHSTARKILGSLLALAVMGPSFTTSAFQFIKPLDQFNMKSALSSLRDSYQPGEPIIIRAPDYQSLAIYGRRMKLTQLFVAEKAWRLTPYRAMRDRLVTIILQSPTKSSWVVSAYGSSEVARGLDELERECCLIQKKISGDGFVVAQLTLRDDYQPPARVLKAAQR